MKTSRECPEKRLRWQWMHRKPQFYRIPHVRGREQLVRVKFGSPEIQDPSHVLRSEHSHYHVSLGLLEGVDKPQISLVSLNHVKLDPSANNAFISHVLNILPSRRQFLKIRLVRAASPARKSEKLHRIHRHQISKDALGPDIPWNISLDDLCFDLLCSFKCSAELRIHPRRSLIPRERLSAQIYQFLVKGCEVSPPKKAREAG
mmetsp:Transcript_31456/g.51083  ORF Transcript_31456/g.51083 Transcript_31456/m.51083 type:complete len:203 (+) Transcript_31456:320-928(+)